jgi:cell division protein FtsZ
MLKAEETPVPQADLFADMFTTKDHSFNEPTSSVVKHQLIEEENEEEPEKELNGFEFNLKVSESEFSQPLVSEEELEEIELLPVNVDEHKTDESMEEQLRKSKERILRLKDLSMKLRSTSGLQELENEPAYKRKQMQLKDVPHSSESQVSRFTLSNEDGQTEIRPNNSFLHDNVD